MEVLVGRTKQGYEEHVEHTATQTDHPPTVLVDFHLGHDFADYHHHQHPENSKQRKSQPGGHPEEDAEGGPSGANLIRTRGELT